MCLGKEENFKIIGSSHTDFTLCIKESLLIHKDKPKLNVIEACHFISLNDHFTMTDIPFFCYFCFVLL